MLDRLVKFNKFYYTHIINWKNEKDGEPIEVSLKLTSQAYEDFSKGFLMQHITSW
jgi:hypothetical protein